MPPWFLLLSLAFAASAQPVITSSPSGPYHVEGSRILDAQGREYLIRGTTLPPVTLNPPSGFGPFSATTLITLRQRMNMNAVRIPIDASEYAENPRYRSFVQDLVQKANRFELLAILESASPIPAADFKSNPNLFFAVPDIAAATAIRSQGATQPIIVNCKSNSGAGSRPALRSAPASTTTLLPNPDCKGGDSRQGDINQAGKDIIYQLSPSYQSLPQTWQHTAPLLITGLDPNQSTPECQAFPSDPAAASKLFEDLLTQFDEHHINWTISTMAPGKLIDNYSGYDWTKLDDGWTCGAPFSGAGIGMALLAHLWRADVHGVFTVNQPAGGLVIARGANASAYGRILAERETSASAPKLSNISMRVTDARGASRLAPLLWTGAGWSSTNLIIPDGAAPGPAEVAVVRSDGSKTASRIIIADTAPGLWTASADGRGAVIAKAYLRGKEFPAWTCANVCRTVPIPISPSAATTIRLEGTGFRHAGAVSVIIDGIALRIESFGPMPSSSRDQVIVKLAGTLIARGETDIYLIADGRISNVARINLGGVGQAVPPANAKPQAYVSQTATAKTQSAVGQAVPPAAPTPTPKSELGRYLFYDKRMSINGTTSCASCHHQDLAFTDGRAKAEGATGQLHPRSAMSLVNLAYSTAFNWNDPTVHSLEQQALKPMRSTTPVELGLNEPAFIKLIASNETYHAMFREAFPQEKNPYTIANITRAIAAFERTITSANSPYDRFHRNGDESAISDSAKRGEVLFFLDGGPSCFRCHTGANFSDSAYHNNGLGAAGKFKTPTLRNIAVTAPYMHDGSLATLEQVVDHYASGGKQGHDPIMRGFTMTPQNRIDLVAFLKALTDENLLHDPRFSNPWP